MSVIQFFKDNITWIKDLGTLIFTAVATVIGILTYIRARATILQPIRTEVIKKQTELLSKLLGILKDEYSFISRLDYFEIVRTNIFKTLIEYQFIVNPNIEIITLLKNQVRGMHICNESFLSKYMNAPDVFEDQSNSQSVDYGKEKFEQVKKGMIEVDKIYLTGKYLDFTELIEEFKNDPFLPTSIKETLSNLLTDINNNLELILKGELESFISDFSKQYFDKDGVVPSFDPNAVYNQFNQNRASHHDHLVKLRQETRKYLRIDENW
jgi:hypothetical protein